MISNVLVETAGIFTPEEISPFLAGEIEAYCVRCRTTHKMKAAQQVTTRNGKLAARGKCQVCGATMMKFLPAR